MNTDKPTLERLSDLELRQYAGDLSAIMGDDRLLYEKLFGLPVEVRIAAHLGICEDRLYQILCIFQGRYEKFEDLRCKITTRLSREFAPPGWNRLSVLFDGIYIGEPEDLLNYRQGNRAGILNPIKGLGEKAAEMIFFN